MEPLVPLLFGVLAAAFTVFVHSARRRAQLTARRAAARAAGLTDVEEADFLLGGSLAGRAGDLRVRLLTYRRGKHERGTRIVIDGLNHGVGGLSLRGEGLGTAFEKMVGEREIELGDEAFDREAYVQGRAPLARALLDPGARRSLLALVRGRIELPGTPALEVRAHLADGVLTVERRERWLGSPRDPLPELVSELLAIARRLVMPPDVAARIAENLPREPVAGVRLACLRTLIEEFPQHPATRDALRAGLEDRSDEVRLRAGLALGEEGRGTLLELATRASSDDDCAARAASALGEHLPSEQAAAVLEQALRARRLATARACIAALGRSGGPSAVPLLARVIDAEPGELALAAAQALGAGGHADGEAALIGALRSDDDALRAAAARALGRGASAGAVQPLLATAEQDPDAGVRRAARQAIAEIQSRLPGAGPGQLSIAAGTAGELSLAEAQEPGRLSLAHREPAALAPAEAEPAPVAPGPPQRRSEHA